MPARGGNQYIPRPDGHRPGDPAPWAALDADRRRFTLDDVRERLAALAPWAEPAPIVGSSPAAVLVPLFEDEGEVFVVLTKRPLTMPSHRGEIAFPGGKHAPAVDTGPRATALREAHEEIGLDPASVEIVARLDDIWTVGSQFVISPFVGFLPGRPEYVPDPREVVRVFEVPLSELMSDEVYREERWHLPDRAVQDLVVHFYELTDETVWGATARILTGFLAHLVAGR